MTLQEAREARGWTITQAARRAGVGHQGLRNLEEGKASPGDVKIKSALAILRLYWPDVSLGEFFGFPPIMPEDVGDTTLFDVQPRDNFAWAHLISSSTSSFRIARS